MRRYQEALVACDQALQGSGTWGDSSPANAWSQRSNAQLGLGKHQDALASADRAIALQPSLAEASHYRGVALWYLKQYTAAQASAEKAIQLNPQFAQAHFSLGRIRSTQQAGAEPRSRYSFAVDDYNQALSQPLQVNVLISCNALLANRSGNIGYLTQDDRNFCAEVLANQSAVYWQLGKYDINNINNYENARKA
ncbi:MAG: tetratricopeptide repeat protein, partial [Leptolyngbyaceae cyanobacterium SU_3_3]|nr:tetratricopeptide repeat protein [Leptolyngbyaceae cyanobacterium SU_3_3]